MATRHPQLTMARKRQKPPEGGFAPCAVAQGQYGHYARTRGRVKDSARTSTGLQPPVSPRCPPPGRNVHQGRGRRPPRLRVDSTAVIPPERRTPAMHATISAGAEFFLRHHVHRRSHDLTRDSKPGWRRFGFPLMYQTDALEILLVLTRLGYRDVRMREALDLVASRADAQGRWRLQQTFNDRFVVPIETRGEPSRWVTLRALEVLRTQ